MTYWIGCAVLAVCLLSAAWAWTARHVTVLVDCRRSHLYAVSVEDRTLYTVYDCAKGVKLTVPMGQLPEPGDGT